jgi:hypothetical protein
MSKDVYPYLEELLGAYFHQDAFDDAASEEEIMEDFKASSWEYQQLGVRADIRRLLHEHADDLLQTIQALFAPQVIVGHTNDEARAWLMKIDSTLGPPASG